MVWAMRMQKVFIFLVCEVVRRARVGEQVLEFEQNAAFLSTFLSVILYTDMFISS
jgi:hypothetical protein